jgi:phosphatidylserine/phosphatidylglycerophosphate/cardiolipin synthase-like enzyme
MMWILIATGFSGALTLVFLARLALRRLDFSPSISVYHSPKGGCTDAVVRVIQTARREILMQAYSFTSKEIADALLAAKSRGVHVEILLDRSNEQETCAELGQLMEQGLIPEIDAHHTLAHNKVLVVDRRTVITGSFDFTNQAETENAENLIILKGHFDVVNSYHRNFVEHKSHCQAPKAKTVSNLKQAA